MILSDEARTRLQETRGIYVTEPCDRCGQLLGPIRFTRARESDVWCSRTCRGDGAVESQGQKFHKGGRPKKYKHERARKNAHAQQQREFRSRSSVTKTYEQPIADKGLRGAVLTSCYGGTTKPEGTAST
jgi:hypothetical protein